MADAGTLSDRQRAVYEKIVAGKRGQLAGPFRVALYSPELADRWQALGEFLRYDSSLPPMLSELAIIMTGRYWNAQVEWLIHASVAAEVGIARDVIEAIRNGVVPEIKDAEQAAIYEFTRELLEFGQVGDDVYQSLLRHIDTVALVELTALVGYYSMVAMTLNAHDVPLPDHGTAAPLDLPANAELIKPTCLPALATE
ncbi:MAG: carboxymuconolactone decarboxylase family protein [Gammaproteobacteria bacterium]|nr:carboxymuconolactone decarboxylase family protein [Gammaproteobacteria bacterium]